MKRTLAALALGLALATAPIQKAEADTTVSLGASFSHHKLIAFKGVLEGEHVGIQAEIARFCTSVDLRYKTSVGDCLNLYTYAGAIGFAPGMYGFLQDPDIKVGLGLELGAGFEIGRKKGLALGLEAGLIFPILPEQNLISSKLNLSLLYRIPFG